MVQKVLQIDFQLGILQSYQNLTIYPLLGNLDGYLDYLTLEETINNNGIEIKEVGRGAVPKLLVINHADKERQLKNSNPVPVAVYRLKC